MNTYKGIVTLFGSRYPRENDLDYQHARTLGRLLAENGYAVCSGGYTGIMEAGSRGAREAGGHTIGVTVETFAGTRNPHIIEEIRARTLFSRLETLISLGEAYVVFRGGMGTIAELCLVWNLIQMKQVRSKRPIFLFGNHWNRLLGDWRVTTDIAEEDYGILKVVAKPQEIIEDLEKKERG
jgi:uncharacterized protein (TIGR00730 family)